MKLPLYLKALLFAFFPLLFLYAYRVINEIGLGPVWQGKQWGAFSAAYLAVLALAFLVVAYLSLLLCREKPKRRGSLVAALLFSLLYLGLILLPQQLFGAVILLQMGVLPAFFGFFAPIPPVLPAILFFAALWKLVSLLKK